MQPSADPRNRLASPLSAATLLVALLAADAHAAPRWVLTFYQQIGNCENADKRTIETHVFNENGTHASGVGVTNMANSSFAVFGFTDADGHNRINPLDLNNCVYDIRIYDPGIATDNTPNFNWQYPAGTGGACNTHVYSYITHWLFVSDSSIVTTFPGTPVFRYDQVDGINQTTGYGAGCNPNNFVQPNGTETDMKVLLSGGWDTYQAQTFVVPAGVNRITSAMAHLTRQAGVKFFYRASIRQGGPNGPQIGPTVTSPEVFSGNFREVAVGWGLNDVPVTPLETYCLRLESTDGQGFNTYVTTQDNVPNAIWYRGPNAAPGREMFAVVAGVGVGPVPMPMITRSPASFTRNIIEGDGLPDDMFTVSNSGDGTLNYTVTDNATWLSVNPAAGSSTGSPNNHTITYNTASLAPGPYTGTVTITGNADNSPQTVVVNLTVAPSPFAPCDFNEDGDVDLGDYGKFQTCYTGPGFAQNDPTCDGAKLDTDDDVDVDDFGYFQLCISGADIPADPDCAD